MGNDGYNNPELTQKAHTETFLIVKLSAHLPSKIQIIMKDQFKSELIHWLTNLLLWWSEDKERAFLLIAVDGDDVSVAYRNQEKLAFEGAVGLACEPCGEAIMETLKTGIDCLNEDRYEDEEWRKAISEVPFDDNSYFWWGANAKELCSEE